MVTILTDTEYSVFQQLKQKDGEAAEIYYGAIIALRADSNKTTIGDEIDIKPKQDRVANPERLPQAAHSIREVLNILLRRIDVPEQTEKQRERIKKFADPTARLPDSFYSPHYELFQLHNWFVNVSHHGHITNETEFDQKLDQYNSIILQILAPYFKAEKEIDQLLKIEQPASENLEEIMTKITNYQLYTYVFRSAQSQWLVLLSKKPYIFKNPPIPETTRQGTIYPTWPESQYLLKVSAEKPKEVFDIISKCDVPRDAKKQNHRVLEDFVRIGRKIPCGYSKRIAKRIATERWKAPYLSLLTDEISKLMKKILDECDDVALSSKLARLVLDVDLIETKTSGKTKFGKQVMPNNSHYYKQSLNETIPKIAQKDPVVATQILAEILHKSIHLDGKARDVDYSKNDHSHWWRPAIEEHPNNRSGFEIKSLLVSSLLDVLQVAAEKDIDQLKRSLGIIGKENYIIFKRLKLFIYKDHFSEFKSEIEKSIIEYFDNVKYRHEYYLLLQSVFPHLDSKIKSQLLELIDNGPDVERLQDILKTEGYRKRWRVDRLEPIIAYVPEKKREYDQLVKEIGTSELSSFPLVSSVSYQVREPTELTEQMTVDETMSYVNKYSVKDDRFSEDDGTVRKFGEMVSKDPKTYSTKSLELLPLRPIFYSELFYALTGAVREETQIDWNVALQLCKRVVDNVDDKFYDTARENVLLRMAELIEVGLSYSKSSIPFANRKQVWVVLETIVSKCQGDGRWVDDQPDGNIDADMISINSHTGQAMSALIQYSVWCYYGLKEDGIRAELVSEAKDLLELRLDPAIDGSISTHAVLGRHLHNLLALDRKWTHKNIPKIFAGGDNNLLGNAAWEVFVLQHPYQEVFIELKDEYEKRITTLQTRIRGDSNDATIKMAQHMGLYYLSGIQNSGYLFDLFLKHAPSNLIGKCIEHIGAILKLHKKEGTMPSVSLRELWNRPKIMERQEHGWLFVNSPLEKDWNIKQLSKCLDKTLGRIEPDWEIFQELSEYSKRFPLETMACVEKIVNTNIDRPEFQRTAEIRKIFKDIKSSHDNAAIDIMNRTLDTLGKAGFEDFREFA